LRPIKSTRRPIGTYIAIAILGYGLLGALTNDIYLPGRHTDGVHLHYDAISPALVGIALFALSFFLEDLDKTRNNLLFRRILLVASICSMAWCCYVIINPPGKRAATLQECRQTFIKLESFAGSIGADSDSADFFRARRARCDIEPILKTFYACVERAKKATDVNECSQEARTLFERKNAS
jgi:hypothetical protein